MPCNDLSKKELVNILELIELSQRCSDSGQVRDLILRARGLFEADYAVCGLLGKDRAGLPRVAAFVNGNYPAEWLNLYMREKYYVKDPVIKHVSRFSLTRFWTEIFTEYKDESSMRLLRDAGDFGLKFGIASGVFIPGLDQTAVFTFAGGRDRFSPHHKRVLDILVLHFQDAVLRSIFAGDRTDPATRCMESSRKGGTDGL